MSGRSVVDLFCAVLCSHHNILRSRLLRLLCRRLYLYDLAYVSSTLHAQNRPSHLHLDLFALVLDVLDLLLYPRTAVVSMCTPQVPRDLAHISLLM